MDTPIYYDFREMADTDELAEVICDDFGNQIAGCWSAEHAEHIVRAVNSHDEMVEALEDFFSHASKPFTVSPTDELFVPQDVLHKMAKALAAAKGEDND